MNHHIIKQIVVEIFDKAKKSCSSHAPNALAKHIADESDYEFNYRTAERAYKRYIDNNTEIGAPIPETINSFCKYLEYEDYKDYVKKTIKNNPKIKGPEDKKAPGNTKTDTSNPNDDNKSRKWLLIITTVLASIIILLLYDYLSKPKIKKENKPPIECMAWVQDHYERVDCNLQLHPKYGTKVESYKPYLEKSMHKLKNDTIDASTTFFSEETGKPLVWYYKTKEGALEYFTAPGLHPINGKTLKKITEGIIEKHVPIHKTQPDSFISDEEVTSTKTEIAILIMNETNYDNQLVTNLKANLFNKNNSIIRLTDSTTYQKNFIYNFSPDKKLYLNHKLIVADTLVIGLSKYNFSNDFDIENIVTCDLFLELSFYIQSDNKWKEITSKNINSIGSGYTKTEAKTNALKKINHE